MTVDESESLEGLVERSYNEKTAEAYAWSRLAENIMWGVLFYLILNHVGMFVALSTYALNLHSEPVNFLTIVWVFAVFFAGLIGTTAGVHRLWSHRSYKAKLPLRIFLMICYSTMGLYSLHNWVRDHRVHHKYSETDADPHNAKRGFMFAHYGWIFIKRHPDCVRKMREVDISDIRADPVVMFQKKYETELKWLFCYIVPVMVPIVFWNESILHAVLTQCLIRYVITMNIALCGNSVAHLWGVRPYNRLINPVDNKVLSFVTVGEGSHNYHHTFPWDYKASELPYMNYNGITLFIHAMEKIGWAYDLRSPSPEFIEQVVRRIGYKSELEEIH